MDRFAPLAAAAGRGNLDAPRIDLTISPYGNAGRCLADPAINLDGAHSTTLLIG
jgi:hypothetical protein